MRLISFFILSLLFTTCTNKTVFYEYNTMQNNSWKRFDNQKFSFEVEKGVNYDIYFTLKHDKSMNRSVDVNITTETPIGELRSREYNFTLKDSKNNWLGEIQSNNIYIELPVRKNFLAREDGSFIVQIENKYPKSQLPGIIEVGLKVYKSD